MSLRLALATIRALARLVPAPAREAWRCEWEAELSAYAAAHDGRARPLRHALAALADARSLRALAGTYRPLPLDALPGDPLMPGLFRDVRYAVRSLLRSPGFTIALVAVLALGIAANTAAFTFANDLLWRTLPGEAPERLVRIYNGYRHGFQWGSVSYPAFEEYAAMDEFDAMIGEAYLPFGIEVDGAAERIWGAVVTPGYFDLLGLVPAAGRLFGADEAAVRGQAPWVVLSEGFWQRRFGGDPRVIGSRLEVNGHPLTILGVAPRDFRGAQTGLAPEIWLPVTMQPQVIPGGDWLEDRRRRELWLVGRLAPGVGIEAARSGLAARLASLRERYPVEHESLVELNVLPEVEGGFHPYYRAPFARFFALLMLVVAMVLMVACTNAAGLLIARSASRGRELAVRQAIGASRWRIGRHLLVEAALITVAATVAGLVLSLLAVRFVAGFQPPTDIPLAFGLPMDARVLAFSTVVALATAMLFGLLPAMRASRADVAEALRSRGGADVGGSRLRALLVVGQVALSLALLIGASLFLRSLGNAAGVDLGFDPAGLQLGSLDLAPRGYDAARGNELFRSLLEDLEAESSIAAVALGARLPFGLDPAPARILPEHLDLGPEGMVPTAEYNVVTPGFLRTVGTRLIEGRDFTQADDADATPVAIVSERLADDFWPAGDALGRRFEALGESWEVVGIAANTKFRTLSGETLPYFYLPLAQHFVSEVTVHARVRSRASVEPLLRRHARALDASVPIFGIKPMEQQVGVALLPARMSAGVLGVFGVLTLTLATIGLYGVLAYAVERRRAELGVRMALGADRGSVLRLMVAQGARLTIAGVVAGLVFGFGLSRMLVGLLYGVSPNDLLSYVLTAAVLLTTALAASVVPALRAAAVDPVVALRAD